MNAFLVIVGVLIVGLLIALWVVKQFNIQTKVFGVPLKYVLDVALLVVAVIAVVVVKTALANKSKALEALLMKLNIMQAQNKINIVNEDIKTKNDELDAVNKQLAAVEPGTKQSDVDALVAQKDASEKTIDDLNKQKAVHTTTQTTLSQKMKDMEAL
jgi:septal ring factor EnvC (AmiA/AmiB activator)